MSEDGKRTMIIVFISCAVLSLAIVGLSLVLYAMTT